MVLNFFYDLVSSLAKVNLDAVQKNFDKKMRSFWRYFPSHVLIKFFVNWSFKASMKNMKRTKDQKKNNLSYFFSFWQQSSKKTPLLTHTMIYSGKLKLCNRCVEKFSDAFCFF